MQLPDLIAHLSEKLSKELPGEKANLEMSARTLSGDRINIKHDKPPRKGSVMIMFYEDNDGIKFPLIKRPDYDGVHSGQMALPGGKKEDSDENDIYTAIRETEEEIGIKSGEITILGSLSSFYVAASNFQILPVLGHFQGIPKFTPQQAEVAEIVSVKLSHLIDDRYLKETEIEVRNGFKIQAPYFDLENRVVWGATAMMLNELRHLLIR